MTFLARYLRLVSVLVMLSILGFGVTDRNALVLGLGLPLAGAIALVTARRGPIAIPRWAVGAAVAVVAGATLWAIRDRAIGVSLFSEFLTAVLIIKLLDRRRSRDETQILALAAFLNVASILTGNRLLTAVLILATLPVLVTAVLSLQVLAAHERAAELRRAQGAPTPPLTMTTSGRAQLRWVTAFAVSLAMVLSVAVFIALPRGLGTAFLGPWGILDARRTTGFTSTVELGIGGLISQSSTGVMDVRYTNESGMSLGGEGRILYLRGAVLRKYERGVWNHVEPASVPSRSRRPETFPSVTMHDEENGPVTFLEVHLRETPRQDAPIFTMLRPAQVEARAEGVLLVNPWDDTVRFQRSPERGRGAERSLTYSVRVEEPQGGAEEPMPRGRSRAVIRLNSPRIQALADEIARDAGIEPSPAARPTTDDAALARALERAVQRRCAYTLDILAAAPGMDAIEWFLFESRRGHCEYFASALAALGHALGLNVRVVTGYVAAEYDERAQSYVVRQSNAHAWNEIESSPGVWRTYDATPSADMLRLHEPSRTLAARLLRWLDRLEYAWDSSVVGFDRAARARLLEADLGPLPSPREALARATRWLDSVLGRGAAEHAPGGAARTALLWAFAAGVLAGMLLLIRRWRRAGRRGARAAPGTAAGTDPLPDYYLRWLDLMNRAGSPKPDALPPLTHIERLGSGARVDTAAAGAVVRVLYRHRFGGVTPGPEELAAIESSLSAMNAAGSRA